MATMTRPIAYDGQDWREGEEFSAADRQMIRRELANAFTGHVDAPSGRQLYEAYTNGTKVICRLRRQAQLNDGDARHLLDSLTTLFISAHIANVTHTFLLGREKPSAGPLLRWLDQASG